MDTMPKDKDKRWEFVRDRRRRVDREAAERKARIEAKELDEIADNIDRGWSKLGRRVCGKMNFSGIGPGQRGSAGRYVMRGGRLTRVS